MYNLSGGDVCLISDDYSSNDILSNNISSIDNDIANDIVNDNSNASTSNTSASNKSTSSSEGSSDVSTRKVRLIVDNRERYIIEALQKLGVIFECANLDICDMQFIHNGLLALVIERKTPMDASASIIDGRMKQQKYRLQRFGEISNERKMVLIEGEIIPSIRYGSLFGSALESMAIDTLVRDAIPVYRTKSLTETVTFLVNVLARLEKLDSIQMERNMDFASAISMKKKDNMDKKVCFLMQLQCIPGISNNISNAIATEYPNMRSLMTAYDELDSEKEKKSLLQDVPLILDDQKSRKRKRVGPAMSKKIYETMFE